MGCCSDYPFMHVVSKYRQNVLSLLSSFVRGAIQVTHCDCGCDYCSVKTMQATLQQRSTVLQQIANKLCGVVGETSTGIQSDSGDQPGAVIQRGHWRARAFKPIGHELKSTVV